MMKKYTEKDIVVYKNFFEPKDFESILDHLDKPACRCCICRRTPLYAIRSGRIFSKHLLDVIKKKTNENYRCYANGHTSGVLVLFIQTGMMKLEENFIC